MQLLLAGGGGRLGSELWPLAVAAGHAVLPLSRELLQAMLQAACSGGLQVHRLLEQVGAGADTDAAKQALREFVCSKACFEAQTVLEAYLKAQHFVPQVLLNLAAFTDVAGAQLAANKEECACLNALWPLLAAVFCRRTGTLLVQISSDFVLPDTKGPHGFTCKEGRTVPAAPLNFYGCSKLAGEQVCLCSGCSCVIVRTGCLFATTGGSLCRTLFLKLRHQESMCLVDDNFLMPTPAAALSKALLDMILKVPVPAADKALAYREQGAAGKVFTLNFACNPALSTAQLARCIYAEGKELGLLYPGAGGFDRLYGQGLLTVTDSLTYARRQGGLRRPADVRLDCRKLQQKFNISPPDWRPYLRAVLPLWAQADGRSID